MNDVLEQGVQRVSKAASVVVLVDSEGRVEIENRNYQTTSPQVVYYEPSDSIGDLGILVVKVLTQKVWLGKDKGKKGWETVPAHFICFGVWSVEEGPMDNNLGPVARLRCRYLAEWDSRSKGVSSIGLLRG